MILQNFLRMDSKLTKIVFISFIYNKGLGHFLIAENNMRILQPMRKTSILICTLLLVSCNGEVSVYNRLGNVVGFVKVQGKSAVIWNWDGVRMGSVEKNEVRNRDGTIVGKLRRREGLILIEGDNATGYLQDGTDCYDVTGYRKGRIGSVIDPEAAAGACLLLILEQ